MRILATFLVLFSWLGCNFNVFCKDAREYSFSLHDLNVSLRPEYREITTNNGQACMVLYSVYSGGQFLHPEGQGGRMQSCGKREPDVINLISEKKQLGWMILGWGICGNTMSRKVELILPSPLSKSYFHKTLISKTTPSLNYLQDNRLEIWYFQQNWGNGNTSESFFVPRKLVIDQSFWGTHSFPGNIFKNIAWFEKNENDLGLKPGFLGLFTAGIQDLNPLLMQYALDNHYIESQKD
ncbi:MAG: hypothetical protein P8P49_00930 [Opitutales bacterium]|nr:hypothetical protein [Opitutales bacterium]